MWTRNRWIFHHYHCLDLHAEWNSSLNFSHVSAKGGNQEIKGSIFIFINWHDKIKLMNTSGPSLLPPGHLGDLVVIPLAWNEWVKNDRSPKKQGVLKHPQNLPYDTQEYCGDKTRLLTRQHCPFSRSYISKKEELTDCKENGSPKKPITKLGQVW